MKEEEPVEMHPSHHKKTMIGLFVMMLIIAAGGLIGENLTWPKWISISVIVLGCFGFLAYILIRINFSRCPTCQGKASQIKSVEIDKGAWEVFECKVCGKRYRIPGVSSSE